MNPKRKGEETREKKMVMVMLKQNPKRGRGSVKVMGTMMLRVPMTVRNSRTNPNQSLSTENARLWNMHSS